MPTAHSKVGFYYYYIRYRETEQSEQQQQRQHNKPLKGKTKQDSSSNNKVSPAELDVWNGGDEEDSERNTIRSISDSNSTLIVLEDFANPQYTWVQKNDPVMGGKSTGTFTVDKENGWGHFSGRVNIVWFLRAPGFIRAETSVPSQFPDISSCEGLQYTIFQEESSELLYEGYRVSFGHNRPAFAFPFIYGYKADLHLKSEPNQKFVTVQIPFMTFTNHWDAGTGDAIVTCQDDPQYCPDVETLRQNMYSMTIWGQGVKGEVDLKLKSIAAYNCFSSTKASASSQGGVSIQQVSPTNNASVKTVTTTTTRNSATASTQGSQQVVASADEIVLEDFTHPINAWATLNDPIMGGQSTSSLTIANGVAHFEGYCSTASSLQVPGFITMATGVFRQRPALFPGVSTCTGLKLILRSPTAATYQGYYVSFGTIRLSKGHHARGYTTPMHEVPPKGEEDSGFGEVLLPFSSFSAKWDEATGKTLVPCSPENSRYCPDVGTLQDMKAMSVWGEGVEGTVDLEIRSIRAYGCAASDSASAMTAKVTLSAMTAEATTSEPQRTNSRSIPMSRGAPMGSAVVVLLLLSVLLAYLARTCRRTTTPKEGGKAAIQKTMKTKEATGLKKKDKPDGFISPIVVAGDGISKHS